MLPHLQSSRHTSVPSQKPSVSPPLTHIRNSYNPAVRHPAFFTERLQKVSAGASVASGSSPVTAGYAYYAHKDSGAGSKL